MLNTIYTCHLNSASHSCDIRTFWPGHFPLLSFQYCTVAMSLCVIGKELPKQINIYLFFINILFFGGWQGSDKYLFSYALDITTDVLLCYHKQCSGNHMLRTIVSIMHNKIPSKSCETAFYIGLLFPVCFPCKSQ